MSGKTILSLLIIILFLGGLIYSSIQIHNDVPIQEEKIIEQDNKIKTFDTNNRDNLIIESTLDNPQPASLKVISCYTNKLEYTEDEIINIIIKNNRGRTIHGSYGNTLLTICSLKTGEIVYQTVATCVLSTMAPYEEDHHIWFQEFDNGTKVPPGKYLIVGYFPPRCDATTITICSS